MGVAAVWILLCILSINVLGTGRSRISATLGGAAGQAVPSDVAPPDTTAPETQGDAAGAAATPTDAGAAAPQPAAEPAAAE